MKIWIIYLLLFLNVQQTVAQIPDSVKRYLDTALIIMQTKSLFSNEVNWSKVKDSVFHKAKNARTYKDVFPALSYAFIKLGDHHGMIANEDTSFRLPQLVNFDTILSNGVKSEFQKGNRIVTHFYENSEIAYLKVPSMMVFSQTDVNKNANKLRDSLCMLLSKKPKGIIIDLRLNAGGNSAPMISGVSPLILDTILGYGVDKDNKFGSPSKIRNGVLLDEDGKSPCSVNNLCKVPSPIKVAVLIGPATASSGEILAVYLKQQKNSRLFGERTGGFCNATEGFLFMNKKGYLLLSVNRIADSKKKIYKDMYVNPDKVISSKNDNFRDLMNDPTFLAAYSWLGNRK